MQKPATTTIMTTTTTTNVTTCTTELEEKKESIEKNYDKNDISIDNNVITSSSTTGVPVENIKNSINTSSTLDSTLPGGEDNIKKINTHMFLGTKNQLQYFLILNLKIQSLKLHFCIYKIFVCRWFSYN